MLRLLLASHLLAACSSSAPPAPTGTVEILEPPATGDLVEYVKQQVQRGEQDRVPVLVYVGATWCAPCREFHAAVQQHELDAELGPLRLLEFDLDRDGVYLEGAGYRSDLVPLFARPNPDGRASGKQFDGVERGVPYVEQLVPKVRALLDR